MKVIQKRSRKPNSAEDTFVWDSLSGVILDITNKPILTDSKWLIISCMGLHDV